jgi:purine-binding chemotaxis protein CheW
VIPVHVVSGAASNRFLTFSLAGQLYALSSEQIQEVIRVPAVARVPQAPEALLGIANLRGTVLPVISLHILLGKSASVDATASRAIVLDIGAPVAVVVDAVAALEVADPKQIDVRPKEVGAGVAERLLGVFSVGMDGRAAKILDIRALLNSTFSNRERAQPRERTFKTTVRASAETGRAQQTETFVTFDVAGQEFALPLAQVQEILPAPATVTALAHSEPVVLGLTAVRDRLLPLLSLRGLLGFAASQRSDERQKVVVVNIEGLHVGLVADRARAIIAAESHLVDPIPPALAARVGGESRVQSVYRGESGRRLISILSPQHLFREDVMQSLAASRPSQEGDDVNRGTTDTKELIFLVFRLGEDEYGLPIDTVAEVARVPEQITRVPKTPKFLEGVVNLRGEVLPVVDQRRRFDMPPREKTEGQRLIVVTTERHRAGLIVDGVSDVLRSRADAVEPAPDLTNETSRLVRGVINLEASNRIVLVLNATELLTRAERGLLDKFKAERERTGA